MAGNKSIDQINFHKNATTVATGLEYINTQDADTLVIDFMGTGSYTSVIETKVSPESDWDERMAVDTKTFDMSTTPNNFNTWELDVKGVPYIRIRLTSVSGSITVIGRLVG